MAIKGLTDRGMAFPQIGNIRKGAKVEGKNAKGETYTRPVDLQYFKVDFDDKETEALTNWTASYPEKPTEINILLPFDEIERCWDAWCEAYTAGRMVARSDGENFLFLVDLTTNKVIVQNGMNADGQQVKHYEVIGKAGKTTIKCRPVGRLKVIIPELKRFAYIVVHTTSVIDIRNISEQLEAIKQIGGGRIVGIPLVLKRRPREISVPNDDGTKRRLVKWMLSIEADPRWVTGKLAQLDRLALPEGNARPALPGVPEETPEDDIPEFPNEDDIEGEIEDMGPVPEEPGQPGLPEEPEFHLADHWPENPKMSYESAAIIKDSGTGELYITLPVDKLTEILLTMKKYLEDNRPTMNTKQVDNLKFKIDAAETILLARG